MVMLKKPSLLAEKLRCEGPTGVEQPEQGIEPWKPVDVQDQQPQGAQFQI